MAAKWLLGIALDGAPRSSPDPARTYGFQSRRLVKGRVPCCSPPDLASGGWFNRSRMFKHMDTMDRIAHPSAMDGLAELIRKEDVAAAGGDEEYRTAQVAAREAER